MMDSCRFADTPEACVCTEGDRVQYGGCVWWKRITRSLVLKDGRFFSCGKDGRLEEV